MKPENSTWPQYIRSGLGLKISKLGERLGCDQLTYNFVIMRSFHSMAVANAPGVVRSFADTFGTGGSLIDVGCGSGAIAAQFLRAGYSIVGCEHSPHGRKLARRQGVNVVDFDLNRKPPADVIGNFEVAYSFEVAEHLTPKLGDALVEFLTRLSIVVVFTAAQPGQGGVGHINEQPIEYWSERFRQHRFELDQVNTDKLRNRFKAYSISPWFSVNACVFRYKST
jgi:SAM-dependent methyltransferase